MYKILWMQCYNLKVTRMPQIDCNTMHWMLWMQCKLIWCTGCTVSMHWMHCCKDKCSVPNFRPLIVVTSTSYHHHHHHGYPAYSHHDKIPPWWGIVSNDEGGNVPVSKTHHTPWWIIFWSIYVYQVTHITSGSFGMNFQVDLSFFTYMVTIMVAFGLEDNDKIREAYLYQ